MVPRIQRVLVLLCALASASCAKTAFGDWTNPLDPYGSGTSVVMVTLSEASLYMGPGGSAQLSATVWPATAIDRNVTWESDSPSVAAVSQSGEVSGISEGSAMISATSVDGSRTASCAVTIRVWSVGEQSPSGGWVFYDKGSYSEGWRFMEAAPKSGYSLKWSIYNIATGASGTAIGTGKANTQTIISVLGTQAQAANYCYHLVLSGHADWFLPSIDELYALYSALHEIDAVKLDLSLPNQSNTYWSSSEADAARAWAFTFDYSGGSNEQNEKTRFSWMYIRAIRSF